jgi:Domain of unknown function (DUF6134)
MERRATCLSSGITLHGHSIHSRALAAAFFVANAIFLPMAEAGQPAPADLEFKIVREGEEVGHHRITFRQDGENLVVRSDLRIEVTVLSATAYRYEQTRSEVWRDHKLVALTSVADDDGTPYDIEAQAGPDGMKVTSHGKSWTLPADSVPASYWNVSMVTAKGRPLIDAQSGRVLDATVTKIGQERVKVRGKEIVATHYRLGTERPRDLWYDAQGRWVKMRAKGSDGSVAEWVLK